MNYKLNATPKELSFLYNSFALFKSAHLLLNIFNNSFFLYRLLLSVGSVIASGGISTLSLQAKNQRASHHCGVRWFS